MRRLLIAIMVGVLGGCIASTGIPPGGSSDAHAVTGTGPVGNAAATNPRLTPPHLASIALIPPGVSGCYYQKPGDEPWQKVACVPPSEVRKRPMPQVDPYANPASNGVPGSISQGYVAVLFSTFSGETDSMFGANAFSVQANSNSFTGNNGDVDWVQIIYGGQGGQSPWLCVYNIDIITNYTPAQTPCAPTTAPGLSPTFFADVSLTVAPVFRRCTLRPHERSCYTDYSLTAAVFTPQGNWAVTAPDFYGLHGNWNQISGTILGFGGGSAANFTSPTQIYSAAGAYAPGANSVSAYFSPPLDTYATGETNNLNLLSQFSTCEAGSDLCYVQATIGN